MRFGFEKPFKKPAPVETQEADMRHEEFKEPKTGVHARFFQMGDHIEVMLNGRIEPTATGNEMPAVHTIFEPGEKAQAEKLYEDVKKVLGEKAAVTDDADAVYEAGAALFSGDDYETV